jgi:hypothetical protein
MKFKKLLENWDLTSLKINLGFLETEWNPQELDREAAWELYVEMLTRVITQPLPDEHGDEKTALDSVYSLFVLTRDVLKRKGRGCVQFTKIAVIVLNQLVRPFTAKWHKLSLEGAFKDQEQCKLFRKELSDLQVELRKYSKLLAEISQVEDMSALEKV